MGCSLSAQILPPSSQHLLTISLWILLNLFLGPRFLYLVVLGKTLGQTSLISLQNLLDDVFLLTSVRRQYSVSISPFLFLLAFLYSFASFFISCISKAPIILVPPMA